jgi:hypothetical protein
LSATAGPVGRTAAASTDALLRSGILSYSRSKGLFVGALLKGASISPDNDLNEAIIVRFLGNGNYEATDAAGNVIKGIVTTTDQPNVSVDFNHDSHSAIFAIDQTKVMDGNLVRVLAWYDNEWGFSNRMCDTTAAMARLD